MPRFLKTLICVLTLAASTTLAAQEQADANDDQSVKELKENIESLDEPMYSPFIERYMLDEIKQLRVDMAAQRTELIQKVADKEVSAADRSITYATNTITYFFYLIAAVSSILVLVGWSSIREIKERVHSIADKEINSLIAQYEKRLRTIEAKLNHETLQIEENREKIERTQEVQSLWLRAGQEHEAIQKIEIYDQILKIRPNDCEALTYKADALLEQDEPRWAINLCQQTLSIDPNHSHAFYQLACAYTQLGQFDDALHYLQEAIEHTESYRSSLLEDEALAPIRELEAFKKLLSNSS